MDQELSNILELLKKALPLKELPRIGWIMEGATRGEADSVASHSYIVTLLCLTLSRELQKKFPQINIERVITMATLHDLSESITGDLDSGFKRLLTKKVEQNNIIAEIEKESFSSLVNNLVDSSELEEIFAEYELGTSKEAKIVKFADTLDAFAHGHLRLHKIFTQYLIDSKTKLEKFSPEMDDGLGIHLSTWLDQIISEWK